jgi:hypothetical protein
MSTIKTNAILDASGGNTTTINGTTPTAYNTMGKNLVINGAMQIAQRGTQSTGITTTGFRTVDHFRTSLSSLGTWTEDQSTDAPSGFSNSFKLTCTTADASPAAGDVAYIRYMFEGLELQNLAYGTSSAKSMTLSFWVKSNKTGSASVQLLQNDNSSKNISPSYTISSADTWEYKTISIPADTAGNIDNDNGPAVSLIWWLNSGSTYSSGSTQTSWSTYSAADSNPANLGVGGATSDYIAITGVQLEVGSVATEFERRPYGTELALCQRYFQKSYNQTETAGTNTQVGVIRFQGATDSSNNLVGTIYFKVNMRTTPTMVYYAQGGTSGVWNARTAAVNTTYTMTTLSAGECNTQAFATNLGTAFYPGFTYGHYTASAEL